MAEHGTRMSYADGCRCAPCKGAQAKYMREWKSQKAGAVVTDIRRPGRPSNAEKATATVPVAPGVKEPGAAELAVIEELATLTSAETRKGAAQAALSMARILDNDLALAQQPAAAGRLEAILENLRRGSARRKGRLASVQAMTKQATG